jgi:iron(III) transport system permease protein
MRSEQSVLLPRISRLRLPRWDFQTVLLASVVVLTVYLVIVPLLFLLWSSFRSAPIGFPSDLTLQNYVSAYGDPGTYKLFGTTVVFAVSSAALALFLGVLFAWLLERTNVPFKEALYSLMPVPIAVPGVLFSIGWVLLLSPQIGVINVFLRWAFDLESPPLNVYSLGGMVFLEGLHLIPVTFLMIAGAFRRMDPSLEEASAVAGGGLFRTLRSVTLRVLWPSIIAAYIYVMISAMESFEIPGVIGMRAGIHVLALRIYLAASQPPTNYGLVSTYAVLLLVISAVLIYLYGKVVGQGERFATITGKAYRPKLIDLGVWKYAALALFVAYFMITVVLPFLILLWASLLPFYEVPSAGALRKLSWDNYFIIWDFPKVGLAFRNTLIMVLLAPTVTMVLCAVISWFIVKSRAKGRRFLDVLTFLPHAIPGIVTGVALMWVYVVLPIPIYGTLWILLVAYVTGRISFGTRVMNAAMTQLHKELEEASYTSGGSWLRTFMKITLPLLMPAFVNGWIFSAIAVARAIGSVIMIYSPGTIVVPVMVWELWNNGEVPPTSALGVMMIVSLIAATFVARTLGLRRL